MKKYTKEDQTFIVQCLKTYFPLNFMYDQNDNKFIESSNGLFWSDVPDKKINEALILYNNDKEKRQLELNKNETQKLFIEKYADAVTYFHHKPFYDVEGIYIKKTIGKKYFTLAELDQLLLEYIKIQKKLNKK